MRPAAWITGANAALSLQALRHAAAQLAAGETKVWPCLYNYGRIRLSPAWMQRFPYEERVEEALSTSRLHPCWREQPPPADNPRWRYFQNGDADAARHGPAPFKIYVNLHPDALATHLCAISHSLHEFDVAMFKVARDVFNLLRADKLVIYLHDMAVQRALSLHLDGLLQGARVQALPFTGAVGEGGAVSCGFDPPPHMLAELQATSWRSWITRECASALQSGFAQRIRGGDLLAHALEQIQQRGVDTGRWVPKIIP
jgi:hypothetical protein